MADIMSIVSTAHKSNVLSSPSGSSTYIPADSSLYQGGRTGTYSDGKKFPLKLSPVGGFRAQVHDGSTGTSHTGRCQSRTARSASGIPSLR